MLYKIKRDDELKKVDKITIYIGLDRYRITKSVDGKLTVNKTSDDDNDSMQVHPRYANQIDIS